MRSYRSLEARPSDKLRFLRISVAVSAKVKSLGSASGRRLEITRINATEKSKAGNELAKYCQGSAGPFIDT